MVVVPVPHMTVYSAEMGLMLTWLRIRMKRRRAEKPAECASGRGGRDLRRVADALTVDAAVAASRRPGQLAEATRQFGQQPPHNAT